MPLPRALPDDDLLVDMPDEALRAAVLRSTGATVLTRGALRQLDTLRDPGSGISDLAGLEFATVLRLVDLSQNPVASIEPLRGLNEIRQLNISSTQVSDLSPVASMPQLNYLQLNRTPVTSIEPLRNTPLLWRIELVGTQVSRLDAVAGLQKLVAIYLADTPVSDLAPLAGLPVLEGISAPRTDVRDLTALAGMNTLHIINVNGARVADLSMIGTWTGLQQAGFANQRVTGAQVTMSKTEQSYRSSEAASAAFRMPEHAPISVAPPVSTTSDGLFLWENIPEDAESLGADVSALPIAGSAVRYSARLTLPLARADFLAGTPAPTRVGARFAFQFGVDGGFADGPFTVSAGGVPGLSLSPAGALEGKPSTEGTFPLTVRRSDVYGNAIVREFSVTVTAANEPLVPARPDPPARPPSDLIEPPIDGPDRLVQTGASPILRLGVAAVAVGAGLGLGSLTRRRRR